MENQDNVSHASTVSLREISAETVRSICNLKVHPAQVAFVAPNAVSIAQAYFEPMAWFRAIYAGEAPVGFVMLYDNAESKKYFLWRLMIAAEHQGKGYGRQALKLVIDYVRTRPDASSLGVSCHSPGGPVEFYKKFGFCETGEIEDDEVILRLALD